jgi:hypothetical protein
VEYSILSRMADYPTLFVVRNWSGSHCAAAKRYSYYRLVVYPTSGVRIWMDRCCCCYSTAVGQSNGHQTADYPTMVVVGRILALDHCYCYSNAGHSNCYPSLAMDPMMMAVRIGLVNYYYFGCSTAVAGYSNFYQMVVHPAMVAVRISALGNRPNCCCSAAAAMHHSNSFPMVDYGPTKIMAVVHRIFGLDHYYFGFGCCSTAVAGHSNGHFGVDPATVLVRIVGPGQHCCFGCCCCCCCCCCCSTTAHYYWQLLLELLEQCCLAAAAAATTMVLMLTLAAHRNSSSETVATGGVVYFLL